MDEQSENEDLSENVVTLNQVNNSLSESERERLDSRRAGLFGGGGSVSTGAFEITPAYAHTLMESVRFYGSIKQIVEQIDKTKSIDSILWLIANRITLDLGLEDLVIYLVSGNKEVLEQRAACGPKSGGGQKIIAPIEIPMGQGIVGSICESGEAEIVRDTRKDSRYILDDVSRLSEITAPILSSDGEVLGAIDSEHSIAGFFTYEHLALFKVVACILGGILEIEMLKTRTSNLETTLRGAVTHFQ